MGIRSRPHDTCHGPTAEKEGCWAPGPSPTASVRVARLRTWGDTLSLYAGGGLLLLVHPWSARSLRARPTGQGSCFCCKNESTSLNARDEGGWGETLTQIPKSRWSGRGKWCQAGTSGWYRGTWSLHFFSACCLSWADHISVLTTSLVTIYENHWLFKVTWATLSNPGIKVAKIHRGNGSKVVTSTLQTAQARQGGLWGHGKSSVEMADNRAQSGSQSRKPNKDWGPETWRRPQWDWRGSFSSKEWGRSPQMPNSF